MCCSLPPLSPSRPALVPLMTWCLDLVTWVFDLVTWFFDLVSRPGIPVFRTTTTQKRLSQQRPLCAGVPIAARAHLPAAAAAVGQPRAVGGARRRRARSAAAAGLLGRCQRCLHARPRGARSAAAAGVHGRGQRCLHARPRSSEQPHGSAECRRRDRRCRESAQRARGQERRRRGRPQIDDYDQEAGPCASADSNRSESVRGGVSSRVPRCDSGGDGGAHAVARMSQFWSRLYF